VPGWGSKRLLKGLYSLDGYERKKKGTHTTDFLQGLAKPEWGLKKKRSGPGRQVVSFGKVKVPRKGEKGKGQNRKGGEVFVVSGNWNIKPKRDCKKAKIARGSITKCRNSVSRGTPCFLGPKERKEFKRKKVHGRCQIHCVS